MTEEGNADSKWGEKKMEGENSVRTVDCLRGRLLAERVASRNAKQEAEQLGNKMTELENMLKQEAKSRNRAEKKLKFLIKKLESMNISYVSDESEYSGLVDKSDISSVTSATSSSTKELQEKNENQQMKISEIFGSQESKKKANSHKESENLQQNDSQNCLLSLSDDSSTTEGSSSSAFEVNFQECEMGSNEDPRSPSVSENVEQNIAQNATVEESLSSSVDGQSEKSSHQSPNQYYNDSKMDEQSDICNHSVGSSAEEGLNQEGDQDPDHHIDNSMALVLVDKPQKNQTIDPEVLDATVKEVLDALRHAKEQLQDSMERRRMDMIKVG